MATGSAPHPLSPLTAAEFTVARDAVVASHPSGTSLYFRSVYLEEPPKAELGPFLAAEHAGDMTAVERPARLARVEHDVVTPGRHRYTSAIVDLDKGEVVKKTEAGLDCQPYITIDEFAGFQGACIKSALFREAMSEFALPEGFTVTMEPWPYGGAGVLEPCRYMQALVFGRDSSKNSPDSNHYPYPIPIIPVLDMATMEVIRIDRLATGGTGDPFEPEPRRPADPPRRLFEDGPRGGMGGGGRRRGGEYMPELLDSPPRADLKPIDLVQPDGPSFTVHPDNLVEWQRWRFRVSFTPREGAVLHDVCYDGRPILYRLSFSEMTVPYADPRAPFHRKQAFDVGDGGLGRAANDLDLGCDCLGAIYYFSALRTSSDGKPAPAGSVVCMHEQDAGILWKHTHSHSRRSVVVRQRELVVQFVATLANYDYVFAYKLDVAGGITVETRATGVVSVTAIDHGKTSEYGTVVAPGVLAQNHQHVFAVRVDPAMDSYGPDDTQVVVEETVPCAPDPDTNPYGNLYSVTREPVRRATWIDAEPFRSRAIRIENATKRNPVSGRNVGYRLAPPPTQLLLMSEDSVHSRRAPFARHHLWVTGYRDGELWAAGEFTNQSIEEVGGVGHMVRRGDWFADGAENEGGENNEPEEEGTGPGAAADKEKGRRSSPVVWSVFCLTHNPRVEDWPVMPAEVNQLHLKPVDFFTANPSIDVPSTRNTASVLVSCCDAKDVPGEQAKTTGAISEQEDALAHLQGSGPDFDARAAGASVVGDIVTPAKKAE